MDQLRIVHTSIVLVVHIEFAPNQYTYSPSAFSRKHGIRRSHRGMKKGCRKQLERVVPKPMFVLQVFPIDILVKFIEDAKQNAFCGFFLLPVTPD
jgi:hypothetical protein